MPDRTHSSSRQEFEKVQPLEELLAQLDLEAESAKELGHARRGGESTSAERVAEHGDTLRDSESLLYMRQDVNPTQGRGIETRTRGDMLKGRKLKLLEDMKPHVDWRAVLGAPEESLSSGTSMSSGSQPKPTRKEEARKEPVPTIEDDTESLLERRCAANKAMDLQGKARNKEKAVSSARMVSVTNIKLQRGRSAWPLPEESLRKQNQAARLSNDAGKLSNDAGRSGPSKPSKRWTSMQNVLNLELAPDSPREQRTEMSPAKCEPLDQRSLENLCSEERFLAKGLPSAALLFGADVEDEVLSVDGDCREENISYPSAEHPHHSCTASLKDAKCAEPRAKEVGHCIENLQDSCTASLKDEEYIEPKAQEGPLGLKGLLMREHIQSSSAVDEFGKSSTCAGGSKTQDIKARAEYLPSFGKDLRFQWLYTDAETDASAKFSLDIFGSESDGKVKACFLDNGVPTSSSVTCTIEGVAIVINEKHRVGWTCYRGCLNDDRTEIFGTWADHSGASEWFQFTKVTTVRDFYFHWQYSDAETNPTHNFTLRLSESAENGQPMGEFLQNGVRTSAMVNCSISKNKIRVEETHGAGWTRYEGELATDGDMISGNWLDHLGGQSKFVLKRLHPSHPAGFQSPLAKGVHRR